MSTKLAKELRLIRVENDENSYTMAKKIGISPSLLSSIENGKRNLSDENIKKICETYSLSEEKQKRLFTIAHELSHYICINLGELSSDQRDVAYTLARKINTLDKAKCEKIFEIVDEDSK